jgi:hypothetical protein
MTKIYLNREIKKETIPEIKPTLVAYKEEYWNKVFPIDLNDISDDDFKKLQISNIGTFNIFLPTYANKIAKLLRKYLSDYETVTITDATSNMGGSIFGFSRYFDSINAVEIVPLHCNILKNNIELFKIDNKVNIICDNYIEIYKFLKQDMIFFDPQWILNKDKLLNLTLNNIPIEHIFKELIKIKAAKFLALVVPYNYDFKKIFSITNKINIHSFYSEDDKLSFNLVIIKII